MTAPSLTADDKASLCAELLKVSGAPQADKTMKNFLDTLAVNNRLSVLFGVCEKFAELMSAHRGEMEMRVTSATPLDAKIVKQLENAVGKSQYVGAGKKLKVVTKVSFVLFHSWCGGADERACTGPAGHPRRPRRRDWRPDDRPERREQDGTHERAAPGKHVKVPIDDGG